MTVTQRSGLVQCAKPVLSWVVSWQKWVSREFFAEDSRHGKNQLEQAE